jgi:RHS repeat-associated protein
VVTKIPNTTLINPNYWNGYHPPFGMQMEERSATYGNRGYRFGFNSKEMDNEVSGVGNQYDYGFRIYNPRLGKFLSIDPLFKSYPWYTPYQFAGNVPIAAIDLDGLEELIVVRWYENGKYKGASAIHIPNARHRVINNNNILYVELDDTRENRSKIKAMQRRKGDWNNAKDLIFDKDENGYKLKQGQVTEATARNKVDQDAFDFCVSNPLNICKMVMTHLRYKAKKTHEFQNWWRFLLTIQNTK